MLPRMFKKGFLININHLELLLTYLWSFMISANTGNRFSMKMAAKQVNDSIYSLEIAVEGFNSNSFCAEVMNVVLGDDSQALIQQVIPRFTNYGPSLYMVHYIRKVMGLKCKCYGGPTAPPTHNTIKTPNQYSRLMQMASTQEAGDHFQGMQKDQPLDCSLKLMVLLERDDLMSQEIDQKFKKVVYQKAPKVRMLNESKLKVLADPRLSELLLNRRTLVSLSYDLEKMQQDIKAGRPLKTMTLDWLSAQSYAEDFLSVAMRNTSNGLHPLDEQILIDQNLGAMEEELFDWNLALCAKLGHLDFGPTISPKALLVNSELVTLPHLTAKKKSESVRKDAKEPHVTSSNNSSEQLDLELADKITELNSKNLLPTDSILQIRSCETKARRLNKGTMDKTRSRFEKYSGPNSRIESCEASEEESSSPTKLKEPTLTRQENSPKVSEMVQRHSSVRDPGTIKTVSSIDFPPDNGVPTNANLGFIRGHEKLM